MVRFTGGLLLFSAFVSAVPTSQTQTPLQQSQHVLNRAKNTPTPPRKLQGKFLHITDFHPDPFYKPGSSSESEHACHSGSGDAGILGAEKTDCDSPVALVNATFQWIADNLKNEVDFVIWTGDSARHDNDESIPRNEGQVVTQNEMLVSKFVEIFGKDDNIDDPDPTNDFVVPIIPTFGNNDILPHNIFERGPNKWTREYSALWRRFIPEEQRHSFERGGWFFVEVIRNELAVFSLNTLYFFENNAAVDGCDAESEPGYEHMEWLRVQLELLRQRGMKAIITGHVPPQRTESKQSWDETCWQKYTLWMRQYRDVVVGAIYGHANIDHFLIQDMRDLKYNFKAEAQPLASMALPGDESITIQSKSTYLNELREVWSELPKPPSGLSYMTASDEENNDKKKSKKRKKKKSKKEKERKKFLKNIGGPWAERFSSSLVSPSVVPNYFPTLRVYEYNITGIGGQDLSTQPFYHADMRDNRAQDEADEDVENKADTELGGEVDEENGHDSLHDLKKKHSGRKNSKKPPFKVPRGPDATAPPGPAYSPQTFTWLAYAQYYANLTHINNKTGKRELDSSKKSHSKDPARTPHPKEFAYELEYHTRDDKVYRMKDLTMRSYLDLAEQIGRGELKKNEKIMEQDSEARTVKKKHKKKHKNKMWHTFVKRAFVLTMDDEEIEEEFGS